ncbi:MAG: sugar phosphate isomerase/epimerase [Bacillota bacterium]|nr:sugar phosphate isomerase/epimerase [Bacillota bacterium]
MKIGVATDMGLIKALGGGVVDYAELNLTSISGYTDEQIENCISISENTGVTMEAAACFFPPTIKLCGSSYSLDVISEYSKNALCKAAKLGIHTCVLGSGGARKIEEGADFDSCKSQFDEAVNAVGDIAKEFGTTIVIEPLNKGETNLINTVKEGAELCRRLNHPNVKLLADFYHVALENEPYTNISENGDLLRHVHIAYPEGRLSPMPEDNFDYAAVKRALKDAEYNLRVSIESRIKTDFYEEVKKSATFLKELFSE